MLRLRSGHMYIIAVNLMVALSAGISGCTINPTLGGLEPDVEKKRFVMSPDISAYVAHKARCEIRDAFVAAATRLLAEFEDKPSMETREKLQDHPGNITKVRFWETSPIAQVRSSIVTSSLFTMSFDLTANENNKNTLDATLLSTQPPHVFTFGIGQHATDLTRENKRTFDFLESQISKLQSLTCHHDKLSHDNTDFYNAATVVQATQNPIYPLTGNIGLQRTVDFFLKYIENGLDITDRQKFARQALYESIMTAIGEKCQGNQTTECFAESTEDQKEIQFSKLDVIRNILERKYSELKQNDNEISKLNPYKCYKQILTRSFNFYNFKYYASQLQYGGKLGAQKDAIKFTTKMSGGLSPSIKFSNASNPLAISGGSISINNTRTDTDLLTIGITPATQYKGTEVHWEAQLIPIGKFKDKPMFVNIPVETNIYIGSIKECLGLPSFPFWNRNLMTGDNSNQMNAETKSANFTGFIAQDIDDPDAVQRLRTIRTNDNFENLVRDALDEKLKESSQ